MKQSRKLLFGKTLLIAFVATVLITILLVYFTGFTTHRSILDNSLISLSVLTICFFLFLTIGLYNGLDVYDNYSHKLQLSWKNAKKRMPDSLDLGFTGTTDIPDVGDSIGGIIIAIFLWLFITIALIILMVLLQAIVWLTLVLLIVAIYWIIIRGLKLIFSKSAECENDLAKSVAYAFGYTVLYIGWIYGVIYVSIIF
jgi:hypothetical protein